MFTCVWLWPSFPFNIPSINIYKSLSEVFANSNQSGQITFAAKTFSKQTLCQTTKVGIRDRQTLKIYHCYCYILLSQSLTETILQSQHSGKEAISSKQLFFADLSRVLPPAEADISLISISKSNQTTSQPPTCSFFVPSKH